MKIERNLNAWRDIVVKVVTDEDIEDMSWAAVIEDHGDKYLVVKMKDGRAYKYGCFANLINSDYVLKGLAKQPQMFRTRTSDKYGNASNRIYVLVHFYIFEMKLINAQFCFDSLLNEVNAVFDEYEGRYFCDSYKKEVREYLEKNDIATDENLAKLESTRWNSRIDGIDGYAGKKELNGGGKVYFDSFVDSYIVDKDDLEIVTDSETDDWGCCGFFLNLSPDPILNANKALYAALESKACGYEDWDDENEKCSIQTAWRDWMNDDKVQFEDDYSVLFQHTTVCENTAYYLVIKETDHKPYAMYLTLEEAAKEVLK